MVKYKNVDFYNDYFRNLDDFSLVEEFVEKDKKYVGVIQADTAIHTPLIEVEIPLNFPHKSLLFWTSSLEGYPHLIKGVRAPGQKESFFNRSWFCLNTPFAETPEGQLYHELGRLSGWFERFLNPNLPPKIEDSRTKNALRIAHLLEWENPDEILEHVNEVGLTFVGDFAENPENFKKTGCLHCKKTNDRFDRFHLYAYKDKIGTNLEIPYVIVDDFCGYNNLEDFLKLRQFYLWDKEIQEELLKNFDLNKDFIPDNTVLNYVTHVDVIKKNRLLIPIDSRHEEAIDLYIQRLEEKPDMSLGKIIPIDTFSDEYSDDWEEEMIEQMRAEQAIEEYEYGWNFFSIGIKVENSIKWFLLWTSRSKRIYQKFTYCFGNYYINNAEHSINISVKQLTELPLNYLLADSVDEKRYFGRGAFDTSLTNKKIAIIGAGAIGSLVATSLVRGGAKHIGIWDGDTVEPGNLCRSAFSNKNVGDNKAQELSSLLRTISPFCNVYAHSYDLYGNINYQSQEDVLKKLKDYDMVIDCTASNELLHFLSYSLNDKLLLSMCITNRSQNLLCISNADGNPFEIRKAYLAKIVQDTRNYYIEGTGCYSPTFLANNSDIATLVNMAMRGVNKDFEQNTIPKTYIYSYDDRGVIADYLHQYQLSDGLSLLISKETLLDIEDMQDSATGTIGKLYGCYSYDGRTIFVTHCIPEYDNQTINEILDVSQGVIDYIGEYRYSIETHGEYPEEAFDYIKELSTKEEINTNNPLLALRNTDGSTTFYLYIAGKLEKMI